jgi:hypothetical protein
MLNYSSYFELLLGIYCVVALGFLASPLKTLALFLFMRAALSIGAVLQIPSFIGGPFFTPALILLLVQASMAMLVGKVRFRINYVIASFLIFIFFVGMISLAFSFSEGNGDKNFEEFSKYLLPFAAYILAYKDLRSKADLSRLTKYIAIGSLFPMGVGLIEVILNTGYSYATDTFEVGDRPSGAIIDANLYGIYLSLCLFLSLPRILQKKPSKTSILYILFIVFSILVARNRGTWIALVLAFAVAVPLFRKYLRVGRWILVSVAVIVIGSPILLARFSELNQYDKWGQKQDTAQGRYEYSLALLNKSLESPLFGHGAGGYDIGVRATKGAAQAPHDDYIRVACQYGFPTMLLFMVFLYTQFHWSKKHKNDELWEYQFASCTCMVYIIIISVAQNLLTDMTTYGLVFVVMALSHRASALSEDERKKAPLIGFGKTLNRTIAP